jgi:hypothetical protein
MMKDCWTFHQFSRKMDSSKDLPPNSDKIEELNLQNPTGFFKSLPNSKLH